MDYYKVYLRKLVGGFLTTTTSKLKPGQVATFKYRDDEPSRRKLNRLVFILSNRPGKSGRLIHAISMQHIPWASFRNFMQKVITYDTLLLIQRRLEIQAPVNELLERPMGFYDLYIKRYLSKHSCYRTYSVSKISGTRISYLDYSTMFSTSRKEERSLLINKHDSVSDVKKERLVIEELLKSEDGLSINNKNARRLIIKRFGSIEVFYNAVRKIDKLVDKDEDVSDIYNKINKNLKK